MAAAILAGPTCWWPDLARFGARLSVAHNPSAGTNYLKLTILDRAQFIAAGGLDKDLDLAQHVRACHFTNVDSELFARADNAYDAAVGQQLRIQYAELAAHQERQRLYAYSRQVQVTWRLLQRLVPAFETSDLHEMEVTAIKHPDFQYLPEHTLRPFLQRLQSACGSDDGALYTTAKERELLHIATAADIPVNALLRYADLPLATAQRFRRSAGPAAPLATFRSILAAEAVLQVVTMDQDGYPLKVPKPKALAIGYPTFQAALDASGGDASGILQERWPFWMPVAFEGQRLMAVRDARFLEFNAICIPEPEDNLVHQPYWALLAKGSARTA